MSEVHELKAHLTESDLFPPSEIDMIASAVAKTGLSRFTSDPRLWSDAVWTVQEELGDKMSPFLSKIPVRGQGVGNLSPEVERVLRILSHLDILSLSGPKFTAVELTDEEREVIIQSVSPKFPEDDPTIVALTERFKSHLLPIPVTENKEAFFARISNFGTRAKVNVLRAYRDAKVVHRDQPRASGESAFEHVRGAALILMDEARIYDPEMIIASLLHDSVEDGKIFGDPAGKSYKDWMSEVYANISQKYGDRVAEMVVAVTKPKFNGIDILSPEDIKRIYLDNLSKASPEAIMVKIADRLYNMRTLEYKSLEKQKAYAKSTIEDYLPILERGSIQYAWASDNLLWEIKDLAYQFMSDKEVVEIQGDPVNRVVVNRVVKSRD